MKAKTWTLAFIAAVAIFTAAWISGSAYAAGIQPAPAPASSAQEITNDTCLGCHSEPGQTTQIPTNETDPAKKVLLYISVDPETFENSVHGQAGINCVQCHTDITGYPHPPVEAQTRREYTLSMRNSCANCHEGPYEAKANDAHTLAQQAGMVEAPVCSDCHGAHDITPPDQPRSRIPQTCQRCHSQIYEQYKGSIHGEALLSGNPDVPSCVDCHNAHNVQGPTNTAFHLWSPQICAQCHADEDLMSKYGVNTNVFDTYLSDFHGTTVTLYQAVTPGQATNKPVCVDCHGVHDMKSVESGDDAEIKQNILVTCQKCHPDANENFPSAWLSHYKASPEHAPTVFFARLFYTIFIPITIGGMFLFVAGDVARRITNQRRKK